MKWYVFQKYLCFGILAAALGLFGYVAYRQLYLAGLQGEARLMLGYLKTLQGVYRLESGSYAVFESYYGAAVDGLDNCQRPHSAEQLGFKVYGCHDERSPIPRYAFRSLSTPEREQDFDLRAQSGSDSLKRSVVCLEPSKSESWQLTKNKPLMQLTSCW